MLKAWCAFGLLLQGAVAFAPIFSLKSEVTFVNPMASTPSLPVIVTITNPEKEAYTLLRWYTPFDDHSDVMKSNMFKAYAKDGTQAIYTGVQMRRDITSEDVIILPAEGTIQTTIDLMKGYQFTEASMYNITYESELSYRAGTSLNNLNSESWARILVKASVGDVLVVERDTIVRNFEKRHGLNHTSSALGWSYAGSCTFSSSQLNWIGTGYNIAESQSKRAYEAIASSTWCSSAYKKWLDYSCNSGSSYRGYVQNTLTKVYNQLHGDQVVFWCGGSKCSSSTYAYVYPSESGSPKYVQLCPKFFDPTYSFPYSCTLDSTGCTIVHEISHFYDIGSTKDTVYHQTPSQNLATTDPYSAIRNADNNCYYTDACP